MNLKWQSTRMKNFLLLHLFISATPFSNETRLLIVACCRRLPHSSVHQMIDLDIFLPFLVTTTSSLCGHVFTTLLISRTFQSYSLSLCVCRIHCVSFSFCVVITDLFDCQIAQLRPADAHFLWVLSGVGACWLANRSQFARKSFSSFYPLPCSFLAFNYDNNGG